MLARHESLRTVFPECDGVPVQVVQPVQPFHLSVEDLTDLDAAQREVRALERATEEAHTPFDLQHGPIFRAALLKLGPQEHVLVFGLHHIVSDGWSMGVFSRELAALYEAFVSHQPSPLAELPIQYADFAVRQRQWLQGEELETHLAYWKEQLADLPTLELPTNHPRPAVQAYRGARQSLALPKTLSESLKALSQREGVTLFMTLVGAFQTLLYRYTNQDDIIVGSPIAGRNRVETEGLIGFFVNTLMLRTDLSDNPTFRELLGRVREVCLGAYAHQALPFEKLVEELQPERDLSRNPLFQVMFVLQNAPTRALARGLNVNSGTSMFDLTLSMGDTEQGLAGSLEYNTD